MITEASVAICAGLIAHSLAFVSFGADSVIELVAGTILIWRLYIEMNGSSLKRIVRAERFSSWVVGIALILLALYFIVTAEYVL